MRKLVHKSKDVARKVFGIRYMMMHVGACEWKRILIAEANVVEV
jgi:hypothetical protein